MQIQKNKSDYKLVEWYFGKKFLIPNSWYCLPFGNGIEFLTDYEANGSYAKLAEFAKVGIGKPYAWFLRSVDLEKNRFGLVKGNQYVNKSSYDFLRKTQLRGGELLLMKVGNIGSVYIMPKVNVPATLGNNLYLIFTNNKLNSKFAYYWFKNNLGNSSLFRIASTTTLPSINKENTKSSLVFYPPFHEQTKIVSILSNIDLLISSYDKIIKSTMKLKKGLMQQLFTKGINHKKIKKTDWGKLPEDWVTSEIGIYCKVGTGGTPQRSKKNYYNGNIPWVKTGEINYNLIKNTEESISKEALENSAAKIYPSGTILFAMYGQGITRGKCAILGIDAAINQACAAIAPKEFLSNVFLFYWIEFKYEKIRTLSSGTHQSNFNLDLVRKILIPIPQKEEQQKISSILSNVDLKLFALKSKKSYLEPFKKGLMQKLLTGQIRVKV